MEFVIILLILAYPTYIIFKWGMIFLEYGKDESPPEIKLSGALHEPPSETKPYLVDALVNRTLVPTGRSISSMVVEMVRKKFISISYKDTFTQTGTRKRKYFLELNETKAKEITKLPRIEQRFLGFIFQGIGTKASFEKIKKFHINEAFATKQFWKYWKEKILFNLMKSEILDKTSYWTEKFFYEDRRNINLQVSYIFLMAKIYFYFKLFEHGGEKLSLVFAAFDFLTMITLWVFRRLMFKRSYIGNDEYSKWMAFRNWLEDYFVTKNNSIDSIILWEKYLVYGMALGISEKALSQLSVNYDIAGSLSESALAFLPIEEYSSRSDKYMFGDFLKDITYLFSSIPKLSENK